MNGLVYILHFERPIAHARHYTGWTTDLPHRIHEHRSGYSHAGRLPQVLFERHIGFVLAYVKEGTRKTERTIKNKNKKGYVKTLCPICRGELTYEQAIELEVQKLGQYGLCLC